MDPIQDQGTRARLDALEQKVETLIVQVFQLQLRISAIEQGAISQGITQKPS
jgi:hypothetical protein